MTADDVARSINCVLLKYSQNTEDQFDNIIKKAYQGSLNYNLCLRLL